MNPPLNDGSVTKFEWQIERSFLTNQKEPNLSPTFPLTNDNETHLSLSFGCEFLDKLVGVVLRVKRQSYKILRIQLRLKCLDENGIELVNKNIGEKEHRFDSMNDKWQMRLTSAESTLVYQNTDLNSQNKSIICCEIIDLTQPLQFNVKLDANSAFRQRLWQSKENESGVDVSIWVEGKVLKVHRLVLISESEVFKAMLTNSQYSETLENRIQIEDFESETFEKLIEWMYLGQIENFDSHVEKLFVAADKYGVEQLKEECADALAASLTNENLIARLILTVLHNHESLKDYIVDYIFHKPSSEIVLLFMSLEWINFVQSHGHLVEDIIKMFRERIK